MSETPKRNKAGKALFKLEFMALMLMAGRNKEASTALDQAMILLRELEQELDNADT